MLWVSHAISTRVASTVAAIIAIALIASIASRRDA
jgi:hypothetical protein